MKNEIPLSVPNLKNDIINNLAECIETGWVSTGGRFITEFERKIADYVGVEDAVSCQSGTAGLHVSLRLLGVEPGDLVIVPTLTFIAAVNPVIYQGAKPIFLDCDESLCLDPNKLEKFLDTECEIIDGSITHKFSERRISAIVIVHVFGNIANMEEVMRIARSWNIPVLEDATEALGSYYLNGKYKNKYAGTIGDIGVYSFNANKIITTGGGGMIVSKNQNLLNKARYLTITAKDDSLHFVHNDIGYNYRMLNLQAALGVSQIDEIEQFIEIKRRNYERYCSNLSNIAGIRVLPFNKDIRANYWFYSLYINSLELKINRDVLMERLIAKGIQCRPIWKLIHTQLPYEKEYAFEIERAYNFRDNILNVPCSTNLRIDEVDFVCNEIIEEMK